MKRKLLLSGLLVLFAASIGIGLYNPPKALAAKSGASIGITETQIKNAKLTYVNAAIIDAKVGGITIRFYDKDIGDQDDSYQIKGYYETDANNLLAYSCDGKLSTRRHSAPSQAKLDLDYVKPGGNPGPCVDISGNTVTLSIAGNDDDIQHPAAPYAPINTIFEISSDSRTIQRVDGMTDGGKWVFTQDASNKSLYVRLPDNDGCQDRIYITQPDGGRGEIYILEKGEPTSIQPVPGKLGAAGCKIKTKGEGWVLNRNNEPMPIGNATNGRATPSNIAGDNNTATQDRNVLCETKGLFSLSWIVCPIVNGLADATDAIFTNLLLPLLQTGSINIYPTNADGTPNPIYTVWSNFRIYANIMLVITLLIVVFGQAIGGGMIDAYTARKVIPRLLIAAIFINISLYVVAFLVDVTNIVGEGVYGIITAPLGNNLKFNVDASIPGAVGLGIGGVVAAGVAGSIFSGPAVSFLLLFVVLPAFLAMMAVIGTLVLRRAIIILLVLISPIAFALYVLPNTEQWFRKWWDLLFRTLLVYPITMAIIASVNVLAATINMANDASGPGVPSFVGQLLAIIAVVLPLFVIPFAFKISGGMMAQIYNTANGLGKKITEAVKGNPNDPNSLRNRTKRGLFARMTQGQQRLIDKGDATIDPETGKKDDSFKSRRARLRSSYAGVWGNVPGRTAAYNKYNNEVAEMMSATGRDALRYAGAGYIIEAGETASDGSVANKRRYFNSKGTRISGQQYRKGKSLFGGNMHAVGSQLEYTTRKAQSDKDIMNMRFALGKNAQANNWNTQEVRDVWAQSTFPHKDKWLSEWFSSPEAVKNSSGQTTGVKFADVTNDMKSFDKMVNEQHRTKQAFQASGLRAQDWQAQNNVMMDIQERMASGGHVTADEHVRYAKIAENLDTMATQAAQGVGGFSVVDGEVRVMGATAESQNVINAMMKNRKYTAAPLQMPDGTFSTTERALYDFEAAKAMSGGPITQTAINSTTVARAHVSDDRSDIPSSVT